MICVVKPNDLNLLRSDILIIEKKTPICLGMRDCTICEKGVLGDEINLLYECTQLDDLRTKYFCFHVIG